MGDPITLESIGLTQEELQARLVQALVDELLMDEGQDAEDGDVSHRRRTEFQNQISQQIAEAIAARVEQIGEVHIIPRIGEMIDSVTLQATNQWGEARGEPMTFTEYLAHRAEQYLVEPVDFNGTPRQHGDYREDRNRDQTRITHMVHQYLHFTIEDAMKAAVKNANDVIAAGLAETCKLKLAKIAEALNVIVEVPR